jgi:hypothetical protein
MRLPLVVFLTLAVTPIFAQQPASSKKTEGAPKPKIVAPAPTPAPKRGVFSRMFGRKPTPTPTPAPTPQPVAKPKSKPRPKPKAVTTAEPATPADAPKPATTESQPPKPGDETPAPSETAKPETKPEPKTAKPGKPVKNAPKPAENLDDATKYKNARATALEDAQIKELKEKADSAVADDEAHRASMAYNKALFRKIRQVDPSIDGYVDKLEEAMMKRLSAEKREQ